MTLEKRIALSHPFGQNQSERMGHPRFVLRWIKAGPSTASATADFAQDDILGCREQGMPCSGPIEWRDR